MCVSIYLARIQAYPPLTHTISAGANNIGATIIRNHFWGLFSIISPCKVALLINLLYFIFGIWSFASPLHISFYKYRSPNSDVFFYSKLSPLKAKKSNMEEIQGAIQKESEEPVFCTTHIHKIKQSDNEQQLLLSHGWKIDNYLGSSREK